MAYTSFDIKKLRQPYTLGTQSPPPTFPDSGVMPQESPIPQVPPNLAQQTQPDTQAQPPANDIAGLMAQLNQIYTPETAARDKYNDLLNSVPERNTPGLARKIVAGGMGLGSKDPLGTMEGVMYAPYLRDMAGWKEKTEPTYRAAQMENTANANERQLAGNVLNAKTQSDRIAETGRIADEKNRITEEKNKAAAESSRIRAEAYNYSARLGKGWDWDLKGPTAIKFNKSTGETIDTGLDTHKMDEETKIRLLNEGKIAAAEASGMSAVERATAAGGQFVIVDGKLYRANPRTTGAATAVEGLPEGTPEKIGTPKADTPLNRARLKNEKLGERWQTDPLVKKYIKKNGNNYDFASRPVVTPGGWFSNAVTQEDVDKYDEFRKEIEPNYTPPKGIAPTGTAETPTTSDKGIGPSKNVVNSGVKPAPSVGLGAGEVMVRDKKTGKKFAMRAENLKKAVETGRYEQVK